MELALEEGLEVSGARGNNFTHHRIAVGIFPFLLLAERADHEIEQFNLNALTEQCHILNYAANDADEMVHDFRGSMVGRDVPCYVVGCLHQHFQQLVSEVFEFWDDAEDRDVAEPFQKIKVDAACMKVNVYTVRHSLPTRCGRRCGLNVMLRHDSLEATHPDTDL